MIRALAKLLAVLNSETEPTQISLGVAFAMVMGFTPLTSPHNLVVLAALLILRTNLSAFLVTFALFSGIAYLLDPLFHALGLALLTAPALEGLWTALYASSFWRLVRFNDSIVMGSLVVSVVLFVPLVLVCNLGVRRYRERLLAWVMRTRLAGFVRATRFWQLYQRVADTGVLP